MWVLESARFGFKTSLGLLSAMCSSQLLPGKDIHHGVRDEGLGRGLRPSTIVGVAGDVKVQESEWEDGCQVTDGAPGSPDLGGPVRAGSEKPSSLQAWATSECHQQAWQQRLCPASGHVLGLLVVSRVMDTGQKAVRKILHLLAASLPAFPRRPSERKGHFPST